MKLRMITVGNISNVGNVSITSVRLAQRTISSAATVLEIVGSNLTDNAMRFLLIAINKIGMQNNK